MAVLRHKHSPGKCPVCGEANSSCGGEHDAKPHPMRMKDKRGAIFQNPNAVIVPDTWDEGTIKRDEAREEPVYATERIILDGRQLYAVGQRIKREDITRLGIVDGALPLTRKEPDGNEAEEGRSREQSARAERSEAEQQERKPKRRGRPPGSRNRRREAP